MKYLPFAIGIAMLLYSLAWLLSLACLNEMVPPDRQRHYHNVTFAIFISIVQILTGLTIINGLK